MWKEWKPKPSDISAEVVGGLILAAVLGGFAFLVARAGELALGWQFAFALLVAMAAANLIMLVWVVRTVPPRPTRAEVTQMIQGGLSEYTQMIADAQRESLFAGRFRAGASGLTLRLRTTHVYRVHDRRLSEGRSVQLVMHNDSHESRSLITVDHGRLFSFSSRSDNNPLRVPPPAGGQFPWRDDSERPSRTSEPGHIWSGKEDALDLAVAARLPNEARSGTEWSLHVPLLREGQFALHPLPNGKYEMVVEVEIGSGSGVAEKVHARMQVEYFGGETLEGELLSVDPRQAAPGQNLG